MLVARSAVIVVRAGTVAAAGIRGGRTRTRSASLSVNGICVWLSIVCLAALAGCAQVGSKAPTPAPSASLGASDYVAIATTGDHYLRACSAAPTCSRPPAASRFFGQIQILVGGRGSGARQPEPGDHWPTGAMVTVGTRGECQP
jgi:hypothetical protein